MGFGSGLPLPLTFATLSFWLSESGVSRSSIGLFVLAGFFYNYKFLWSPLIDQLPVPVLTRWLGRRRGWAIMLQFALMGAIFLLGRSDPATALTDTALLAVLVAFLSASQDIVIDAFRIELLRPEEQGAGVAATQWGYRFGMLAGTAGALWAAELSSWATAYALMAGLMLVGTAGAAMAPEPRTGQEAIRLGKGWLRAAVIEPFADILRRKGIFSIIAFVILYKFGVALAGAMANPFYNELGFSKGEVASIAKLVGFGATLAGVGLGGAMVARFGLFRALLLGGILQMISNLMYVALAAAGHDRFWLAGLIFIENFTDGMGSAAFVAYMSGLCSAAFTATQYALLSSLAAVPTRILASPSGFLVDQLGWIPFFLLATACALPGIWFLLRRLPRP